MDRVISFSVAPTDQDSISAIKKLKLHSKKTGISLSFLILKAIKTAVKDLNL